MRPARQKKIPRLNDRQPLALRPITITRGFTQAAPGSVLIRAGQTHVLCTATIDEKVPEWKKGKGEGWVTAEYEMLPGSTGQRRKRDRAGKLDGRTSEIQRLIGRSLRAIVDMKRLGERAIWLDCDVLQADGGTRTASITGAYIALMDAISHLKRQGLIEQDPIVDSVAAISTGVVDGRVLLDLDYSEDSRAEVDFNVVMTGSGRFVEVQGSAEGRPFTHRQMSRMLSAAGRGIRELHKIQGQTLRGKKR